MDPIFFFVKILLCEVGALNFFRSCLLLKFFDIFFWLRLVKLTLFGIDNPFLCLVIIISVICFYAKIDIPYLSYILFSDVPCYLTIFLLPSPQNSNFYNFYDMTSFIVKFKFFRSWAWTEDLFLTNHWFHVICKEYTSRKCSRFL